jgi:hypothetical protein
LEPFAECAASVGQASKPRRRGDAVKLKSRLTNGSTLLPTADGNSAWVRLVRDTIGNLVSHCGGIDTVSETQRLAARRVSVLEAELIYLEDKFAIARQQGEEPDPDLLDLYGRLADRQRRLSDPLGWKRTPKDVSSNLGDFMRMASMTPASASEPIEAVDFVAPAPSTHSASPQGPPRCLLRMVKYECTARRALYEVPK